MSWTPIRVCKYTRSIHPDDQQPGLPLALDNDILQDNWERWHVQKNDAGEWVGRNAIINQWLVDNSNNIMPYADNAEAEQPKRKAKKRKAWSK